MCTDKSMDILPECSSVSRRKMITKKEILDAIHGKMIISRQVVFQAKTLQTDADIDDYVEKIRSQLKQLLKNCDEIKLN